MKPTRTSLSIACAIGFLTGLRAILAVDLPDLVALMTVDTMPSDAAGIAWTEYVRWPETARAAAVESLIRTIGVLLLAAAAASALNAVIVLAEASGERRREFAIRSALGASPLMLSRQLFREVALSLTWGVALGLIAGAAAGAALRAGWPHTLVAVRTGVVGSIPMDLLAGVGLLVGLVLVAQLTGVRAISKEESAQDALRTGDRATSEPGAIFVRRALAAGHVAVSGTLVLCAIAIASTTMIADAPDSLDDSGQRHVTTLSAATGPDWAAVLEAVAAIPGIEAESLSAPGSLLGLGIRDVSTTQCGACARGLFPAPLWNTLADHHVVSSRYFEVNGFEVTEGRTFSDEDSADTEPVVLVNRRLAETAFENGAPIGKRLQIGSGLGPWYRVIGIVDDAPVRGLGTEDRTREAVYVNIVQRPVRTARLVLQGDPSAVDDVIRGVQAMGYASSEPMELIAWRADRNAALTWARRLAWVLAAISFVLAITGTRAVAVQIGRRRAPDLAIRRAIGATRRHLLYTVLRERLRTAGWGLAGFALLGTLMAAFIERASGTPPPAFGVWVAVATLMLVASAGAGTGVGTVGTHRGLHDERRP